MKKSILLLLMLFASSCSHFLGFGKKISMDFTGEVGHKDDYAIFSQTLVENLKDGQLVSQKMEIVDFNVTNEITQVDSAKNIHVTEITTRKDGTISLHDMAYPELNEKIDFVFTRFGNILKAGKYPKGSLFFTPPLPLPQKEVGVGDVWKYEGEWKSPSLQSPIKIKLQMVLKKLIPCYVNETCAGVEWEGDLVPATPGVRLPIANKIRGYTMYRPKTATQLWTYMRNIESFSIQNLKLQISSCVQSILKNDVSNVNPYIKRDPYCDPSKDELSQFEE